MCKKLLINTKVQTLNLTSPGFKNHQTCSLLKMASKEEVLAARQAKKLAKQKSKKKDSKFNTLEVTKVPPQNEEILTEPTVKEESTNSKSKDEVDRSSLNKVENADMLKEQINAEISTKKMAKQVKKKGLVDSENDKCFQDLTVKDVVETLKDIVNVAKEIKEVTAKVNAMELEPDKKNEETGKSKAQLRAERRAQQEAQRAAKQAVTSQKTNKPKDEPVISEVKKEEKPVKQKTLDKSKAKLQKTSTANWFQQLPAEKDKETLKHIPINSNLHPAVIKLGVQLATRVVTGSNARCIALLDALKKMVRDYALPAKTEFSRGLESHLAASLEYLWKKRPPAASQTNAVKFFRYHLTQLPNNVDEFDAKKILQEEIERYIREQIDMAGEAISMAVRNKISSGDNILTYGCSSLIERIFREAWQAGVKFRAVLVGARGARHQEMLRRLRAIGLPCAVADVTALSFVMSTVNKAIIGASALLVDGSVVGAAGTAQVALSARAHNVPLLVAAETHKFSASVRAAALDYTELGDPDDLIDRTDENCPLKDWRSNPNLTLLNLTYDVTPPSLVTAVVTELAILPCTSAPVVLRFKLSEYGI